MRDEQRDSGVVGAPMYRGAIYDVGPPDPLLGGLDVVRRAENALAGFLASGRDTDIDANMARIAGRENELAVPPREPTTENNPVLGSLERLARNARAVWDRLERIKEKNGTVTGTVLDVVEGGLIVDIRFTNGLRGFMPTAQNEILQMRDLRAYIGEDVDARIIEVDAHREIVLLSSHDLLQGPASEGRPAIGEIYRQAFDAAAPAGAYDVEVELRRLRQRLSGT